jgi:hypothetical protein
MRKRSMSLTAVEAAQIDACTQRRASRKHELHAGVAEVVQNKVTRLRTAW